MEHFHNWMNGTFASVNKWFAGTRLTLNFDETSWNIILATQINLIIDYSDTIIREAETPFLSLWTDDNLNCKTNTECIDTKLGSACFVRRTATSPTMPGTSK